MTRLYVALLVALASLSVAADDANDAVKDELQKLRGDWQASSFETNGQKPFPDSQLYIVDTTITVDGKFKVDVSETTVIEATLKIDPTKKPKAIDFTFTEGQLAGKTCLGIYKLTDEDLTYCRAAPGKPRPTEFSAKKGSEQTLVVYYRRRTK